MPPLLNRAGTRAFAAMRGAGARPAPGPGTEPKRMTWAKALPIIGVALIFWLVRGFFESFWFTGPALVGTAAGAWLSNYVGSLLGGLAGAGAALFTGAVGGEVFEVIGIGIAEPVAFLGWLTVGLILVLVDGRLFREDPRALIWFGAGLLIAEIPLVGALPSILAATVWLLRDQIRRERVAHRAWQARVEAARAAEAQATQAEIAMLRIERLRAEAANDNAIPQESLLAA